LAPRRNRRFQDCGGRIRWAALTGFDLDPRQNREAHVMKDLSDQTRPDHLGRSPAPQPGTILTSGGGDRQNREIAQQVDDVAQVLAPSHGGDGFIEHLFEVLCSQSMGAQQTDIEVRVFRERRGHDAFWHGLDQQFTGALAELLFDEVPRVLALEELVADVEAPGGTRSSGSDTW
jgi:hypothetical protein